MKINAGSNEWTCTYDFVTNLGFIESAKSLEFPKINSETMNVLLYENHVSIWDYFNNIKSFFIHICKIYIYIFFASFC